MIFDALGKLAVAQFLYGDNINASVTGVAGTGAVGTVTPKVSATITGVSATGQVGTLSDTASSTLTGVSATGAVGTVTPTVAVTLTGLSATGAVGTLAPAYTVPLTGLSATGEVGTLGISINVALSGLAATGQVGQLFPSNVVGSGIYVPQNYYDLLKKDGLERETRLSDERRRGLDDHNDIKRLARRAMLGIPETPMPANIEEDVIEVLLLGE